MAHLPTKITKVRNGKATHSESTQGQEYLITVQNLTSFQIACKNGHVDVVKLRI